MFFGRVIGSAVATIKDDKLFGCKLMIVQKTNYDGEDEGNPIIAVDTVRTGVGDFVFMAKGKEASLPFGDMEHPVDAAIIGIIDKVNVDLLKHCEKVYMLKNDENVDTAKNDEKKILPGGE